ncbi:protein sel-1 homolog 3 isoform X2 [Protopterus annectens]|nr:protein sel-1 homolog 3 isoform X2 [Protopterus annectens]
MVPSYCAFTRYVTTVTIPSKEDWQYNEEFIEFTDKPDVVSNISEVSVRYLCSKPCIINVEALASSEFQVGVPVYKKRWKSEKHFHIHRTARVPITFPSMLVYRDDCLLKHSISVHSVILRAWIVPKDLWDQNSENSEEMRTYQNAAVKTYSLVEPISVFERPIKDHKKCIRWDVQYKCKLYADKIPQCFRETDVVEILSFPYASTGEKFGLVKPFDRFKNYELESLRKMRMENPRFTISIWVYLLHWCKARLCGIIHHLSDGLYSTPMLFLTESGFIHIQLQLVLGRDIAVKTHYKIPLRRWNRLDLSLEGRKMTFTSRLGENMEEKQSLLYICDEDVFFNDTAGFFVLGGSKHVPGIEGFFGPVKVYRLTALTTDEIFNLPFGRNINELMDAYYTRCEDVKEIVFLFSQIVNQGRMLEEKNTCGNYYSMLNGRFGDKPLCDSFPWGPHEREEYNNLFHLLSEMIHDLPTDLSDQLEVTSYVGKRIFEKVTEKLSGPQGLDYVSSLLPSLLDSSCCDYHRATYFLAVIYEMGLRVYQHSSQGLLYSLVAAQGDDRLALMHLGYKHLQGIDGYLLDHDLSYGYYANIAAQTSLDRRITEGKQTYVEIVRLIDDQALKTQTDENGDYFLWVKHLATQGNTAAMQQVAAMLYWGQNGVSRNIEAALEWYRRGAVEIGDPTMMYDYSLLLFKGDGVQENRRLALKLMKKAAAKGSHQAFNGLGWYYHNYRRNFTKAVKYWQRAQELGNSDAVHNLGVLYYEGLYPGVAEKNDTLAFEYFLKAAEGGHMEGAIRCSSFYSTGEIKSVPRNPRMAVLMAKYVAEQNGYLGYTIRTALNAYKDMSWHKALLYYLLTAETGIEMSQTNIAYICEENPELASSHLSSDCVWRYYNLSANQINSPTFAYLKMGDLYYYGYPNRSRNIDLAGVMYAEAASQSDSQGFYNLASLIEEGHSLSPVILDHLQINRTVWSSNYSLLLELYKRCNFYSAKESVSPCLLALFRLHLTVAWNSMLRDTMVHITATILLSLLIVIVLQHLQAIPGLQWLAGTESPARYVMDRSEQMDQGPSTPVIPTNTSTERNIFIIRLARLFRFAAIIEAIRGMEERLHLHWNVGEWLFTVSGISICIACIVITLHVI